MAYQGAETLSIYNMDVGCTQVGGLEPQPLHYNITWAQPHPIFLKSIPDLHRPNSVRVPPYAHPQHIKVLKHSVYIWHGCGMHSKWVWSLNHDITTSLRLRPTPIFPKSTPDLHMPNRVRADPYAHPRHIKVLKHFVYIWHGCGMDSKLVWSANHDMTTSQALPYPNFPKIYSWPAQA